MQKTNTSRAKEEVKIAAENALKLVNSAALENAKLLASAISDASKLLASQAESARQVVATQASEALKVSHQTNSEDHDSITQLIRDVANIDKRFSEKFQEVRTDINELKNNTVGRIDQLEMTCINKTDHEKVVNDIVMLKNKNYWFVGAGAIIGIVIVLISYIWTSQIGNINMNLKDVETKLDNHVAQK